MHAETLLRKGPEAPVESPTSLSLEQATHGPSRGELAALVGTTFALLILCVAFVSDYRRAVDAFGDSSAYMSLASAIRRWDFHGIIIKQFWGLPYAMAAFSKVTGASDRTSLLLFSLVPSFFSVLLARCLWGGWVASYFAILNIPWLQISCLGGSEPLFVCLLLASFVNVRRERWLLASLFASFATIVRPLGVFALIGMGLVLLWRRQFGRFVAAATIGLAVGVLYAIPLARHFGDGLATVNSYHSKEWQGGWLFGVPFYAIIKGTLIYPAPWTNLVLSFGWIALVVIAVIVMVRSIKFREYCKAHSVEALFLVPYLWCIFAYNYPSWARSNFPRFAIPIIPFVLLALYRWIPKDRRILWALGLANSVLAASSALGVANVAQMVRRAIG